MAKVIQFPIAKEIAPPRQPSTGWVQAIDRGLFCERHFSWLCGCGSGRCQEEFFNLLVRIGWEATWATRT